MNILQIKCILKNAARVYKEHFLNCSFLIVYIENTQVKYKEVFCSQSNFMHLTGLNIKMNPNKFFDLCYAGYLPDSLVVMKKGGTTRQKLNVIERMDQIVTSPTMIGDYNQKGLLLNADFLIGDTRATLSLAFDIKEGEEKHHPVSLLEGDVKDFIATPFKVAAILKKSFDSQKYMNRTFVAKDIDFDDLAASCPEILAKIQQ